MTEKPETKKATKEEINYLIKEEKTLEVLEETLSIIAQDMAQHNNNIVNLWSIFTFKYKLPKNDKITLNRITREFKVEGEPLTT
jgi:hypothetical protein